MDIRIGRAKIKRDLRIGPRKRLLIIEDDTDVREFLKEELSVYFEVVAEADGNAGLVREP